MTTTSIHDDGIVRRVPSSVGDPVDRSAVARAILVAICSGGGTFDQRGRAYTGSGFLVGGAGPGMVIDPRKPGTLRQLVDWVHQAAPVVSERAGLYFGAWVCGGLLYLDVTQHYSDEDYTVAHRAAQARQQQAVWKADGHGGGHEIR